MSRSLSPPWAILVVALFPFAISRAESGHFEQIDLFQSETGGYAHYRIPGIVVTTRGTLLAYCEARKSTKGDWGTIDLLIRRSTDGGKTWNPARKLATPPDDAVKNPVALAQNLGGNDEITMNNPVAIVDRQTGSVHVLYCVEYARCFWMRSDDDGLTFTKPVEITSVFEKYRPEYEWKVLATGPGHGIQLDSGRLLVPVWLSTGTGGHAHRPSVVSVVYSDDHGQTWNRGSIVVAHPEPINPSETAAIQLADGRIMLNLRHESQPHLRGVTISPDGVSNWSPMRYDPALPEPICFGSLVRLSRKPDQDRNRILFVNPHNPDGRERRNLTVKLSYDEGRTWTVARSVEPGLSGYADLAVGPDRNIHCFFERGSAGAGATNPRSLSLATFDLAWLTEGKDRLAAAHRPGVSSWISDAAGEYHQLVENREPAPNLDEPRTGLEPHPKCITGSNLPAVPLGLTHDRRGA